MNWLRYLIPYRYRDTSAQVAKSRLQIIISHERMRRSTPDYIPMLQQDLLDVITKYVHVDREHVKVALQRTGNNAVLELNILLPEEETSVA